MIGGIKKIGEFVRKETVLTVALLLAVISAFIVPPDSAYVDYIDFRTLAILFCLMTVVAGFSQQGMFGIIAKSMINRMGSLRTVTIVLIFMCFFFSMFITNDVSLITFVPMTLTVLGMAGEEVLTRWMVPVITLQTIAANLGSMLTPIGNPQNLYLYGLAGISAGRFVLLMLPYTVASAALLVICVIVCMKGKNRQLEIRLSGSDIQVNRKLVGIYSILFVLSLLTVARIVPYWVTFAVVLVVVLICQRRLLLKVDYSLIFTFVGFFVFIPCQSGHKQCSGCSIAVRIYRQVHRPDSRYQSRRTWNFDSIYGESDLIQICGETGQGCQRKISGVFHICKCAVPGGAYMHVGNNILARKILPLDGSSHKIEW